MQTRFRKKKTFARLVVPALALGCFSYFGFHAWHGTFGLQSSSHLEERRVELTARLDQLREYRGTLERRVALMSDGSMEADMLDERARYMLNVARADEVVYFVDHQD
ncbi:FtsB family cell division protein [Pseudohoeflea coraliihabitans]|uniref:Septum formation initiator family protein n=1 Tax=Pseudohoeflea coraliihabitans TaxID=2860393 RepID=A0ABS6WR62_9HYPH|nr:septum formation initiator family protein [Pseudohoeflea sp. DP4N28-3]MBW3098469.1 septum formation initiator family protein [Pseudohoeflea sp. DP4N28-3]